MEQMLSKTVLRSSSIVSRTIPKQMRFYSAGDTGAPRGEQGGDAFTQREKAQEDYYVRQREAEKLASLKEQLKKHQEEVDTLKKRVDDLEKK